MSLYSALSNQNTTVVVTANTTACDGASTAFYLTLGSWPNFSQVDRILLMSSTGTLGNPTIEILNNGAAYRADTTKKERILDSASGVAASGKAVIEFNGNFIEDELRTNCLHLRISFGAAPAAGVTFNVRVEGKRLQTIKVDDAGDTGFKADRTARILRQPTSGNAIDITTELLQNGNPYGIGGNSNSLSHIALVSDSEFLYVGSAKTFKGVMVNPHTSWSQPAGVTLTAQYWNGTTWTALTVQNNTSDGQAAESTFSYPGTINWTAPAAWRRTQISTDPLKVLMDDIIAGNAYPLAVTNPDRYWVRFAMTGSSAPFRAVSLRILE